MSVHPDIAAVLSGERRWTVLTADCLSVLPTLPKGSVDCVVTDPPYGCGKAEWDSEFPTAWFLPARLSALATIIITGSIGLRDTMRLAGDDVVDVIAARNMNGLTRGPLGFCNWLAAVYIGAKPRQGPNAFDFSIRSEMPDHPSPKPIEYMRKLVLRVTEPGALILDCFCGSGTTGVAAMQTGRRFIGIEIDEGYAAIARRRIAEAADTLFSPEPKREEQGVLI